MRQTPKSVCQRIIFLVGVFVWVLSQSVAAESSDCNETYVLEHGEVNITHEEIAINNTIPVACEDGYDIYGPLYITCLPGGVWSNDTQCRSKDCGRKYSLQNGYADFDGRDTTYQQQVPVHCNTGYEIIGEIVTICMADGKWSTGTNCSIVDCGDNHGITNGYVKGTNTTYNSTAQVVCNPGYEVDGNSIITCLDDGSWSSGATCKIKSCGKSYTIENGRVNFQGKDTTINQEIGIECYSGYDLVGGKFIKCNASGQWWTEAHCQIKDCGKDYTVKNGFVNLSGRETTYGKQIEVHCYSGYNIVGGGVIKCDSNGQWRTDSYCQIKDCGRNHTIPNAKIKFLGDNTTYNSIAEVMCYPGYALYGKSKITCLETGYWSNDTECRIKDCGTDYTIPNGFIDFTGSNTTYNSTAKVICNSGYEVYGNYTITCLHHGYWSNDTTCNIKDCGSDFPLEYGYINFTGLKTTFNESVLVNCDIGYEIHGADRITCLPEGTWSTNSACHIKDCGFNYSIESGYAEFNGSNTTYNETVRVSCDAGFDIQGDHAIACQHDGTWSNNTRCVANGSSATLLLPFLASVIPVFLVLSSFATIILFYLKRAGKRGLINEEEGQNSEQIDMELNDLEREFKPGPVSLVDFPVHVDKLHANSDLLFADGFRRLKEESPTHPKTAAELESCRPKNRYHDILPFDHSRVKLIPFDDDEGSDFINASYIPGYNLRREYIVTQGPMPSTRDDFWQMVWEQRVDIIVMLTKCVERGRLKCEQYWPSKVHEPVFSGELVINMRSESALADHFIRIIELTLESKTQIVTHFQYLKWPDHGCPVSTWQLLNFITSVRQFKRPVSTGPMLIHCSAGVGRTGTYIAVDRLLQHVRDHDDIDVYAVLLDMRNYRSNMVQTEDQFIYVYECLRHFITKENDDEYAVSANPFPAAAFENTAFQRE